MHFVHFLLLCVFLYIVSSQAIVQRYLLPEIWEQVAVPLLLRPFWESVILLFILLLILGAAAGFFSRRRVAHPKERS